MGAISSQVQKELPGLRGFSASNIKNMHQFYEAWCDVVDNSTAMAVKVALFSNQTEIVNTIQTQLLDLSVFLSLIFTHHLEMLGKTTELDER